MTSAINLLREVSLLLSSILLIAAGGRHIQIVLTVRPLPDPFGLPAPVLLPPCALLFLFVVSIVIFYVIESCLFRASKVFDFKVNPLVDS